MKRITSLISLFIIYTAIICFCPFITELDRSLIIHTQNILKNIPIAIPLLCDCILYSTMIALPILTTILFCIKPKRYIPIFSITTMPVVAFALNCIIKPTIHRARPPMELQLAIHPESYSYVSSHSLVTCGLWGMLIYYVNKNCTNIYIKNIVTLFSIFWIAFVGLSRIWLGVHNPTDVIGAYILAVILIWGFIKAEEHYE